MNKYLIFGLGIVLLILSLTFLSCQNGKDVIDDSQAAAEPASQEKEILYYTCGMHPSVKVSVEDHEAGNDKCPICNMDLVPVYKEGEMPMEGHDQEGMAVLPELKLSPRAQALARVEIEETRFLPLFKEISAVGQLVFDERNVGMVAAWIPGRLDKLYVNFTGVEVKKDSPLALIYSPNLLTTQEEFLLALETKDSLAQSQDSDAVDGAEALVEAAWKRLRLWGISDKQIKELEKSRNTQTHMTIHAPIGGTVIQKNALEGQYVKAGDNLFQIADLASLWMEAEIYEDDLAHIKKGQHVSITSQAYPGEEFAGMIAFIEPYLDARTRTVKARVDIPNHAQKLKPGMFVNAFIHVHIHEGITAPEKDMYICPMCPEVLSATPGECPECGMDLVKKPPAPAGTILAVPKAAVLDTGERKLVYIEKEPGSYSPREVSLGGEAFALIAGEKQRFYVVLAGLEEGIKVVTQANFLIDSQSQITGQAEAIYSGALERGEEKKPPAKHIH